MRWPRFLLSGIAAALILCSASPARADRPIKPNAPEIPDAAWVNSSPFTLKQLRRRRVVLITFINAFTINSIRTFGRLNEWWDRYALEGLMIIGIHTPDFGFDRDPLQVRNAIKHFNIKFPVMIDSRKEAWSAYRAEGWPAHFLVDHKGRIAFDRLGEGGYAEFEQEILNALDDFNGYRPKKDFNIPKDRERVDCGKATGPLYLGGNRGTTVTELKNERLLPNLVIRSGEISALGNWRTEDTSLRYDGRQSKLVDHARLIYMGAECAATLTRLKPKPGRIYLKQDDLWLHAGNANIDVQWDSEDRSFVLVDEPRLYFLTKDKREDLLHELSLFPAETGLGISSFDFSDRCDTDYPHR